MVISCDILPATGDESLVTDFVPVSPPRHLHPDTGELVVKPDAVQSCPPRNKKVKDKKGQGDGMERKAEKNVTETSEETFYVVLPSVIFFTFFLHMLECVDVCIKCLFFFFSFLFFQHHKHVCFDYRDNPTLQTQICVCWFVLAP